MKEMAFIKVEIPQKTLDKARNRRRTIKFTIECSFDENLNLAPRITRHYGDDTVRSRNLMSPSQSPEEWEASTEEAGASAATGTDQGITPSSTERFLARRSTESGDPVLRL